MTTIVMRHYPDLEDGPEEMDGLIEVEANEHEVDIIPFPRTDASVTYSLSIEEAWRLARELVKAACAAEAWEG